MTTIEQILGELGFDRQCCISELALSTGKTQKYNRRIIYKGMADGLISKGRPRENESCSAYGGWRTVLTYRATQPGDMKPFQEMETGRQIRELTDRTIDTRGIVGDALRARTILELTWR